MSNEQIVYKTDSLTSEEIKAAVRIQLQELNEGFLSSLGEKPLTLIFSFAASNPSGVLVLAKNSETDKVIGYVLGSTNTRRFYKEFLVKRFVPAVVYFLPRMLSLAKIKKGFETLLYPMRKKEENTQEKKCDAELLDLAVTKDYHGKGIAPRLFEMLVQQFHQKGAQCFDIPTTEGLERAHHFYEKMGAQRVGVVYVHGQQKTFIYQYHIEENGR